MRAAERYLNRGNRKYVTGLVPVSGAAARCVALDKSLSFLPLGFRNRKRGVFIPVRMSGRQEQSPAEPVVLSDAYSPTSVEGVLCYVKPKEGGTRLWGGSAEPHVGLAVRVSRRNR